MSFLVGVEIDNSRIAWIINSQKTNSKLVKLTTLRDNQRNAVIKIYIKSKSRKKLIGTETIKGIPAAEAGAPLINLKCSVSGRILHYEIYLNGRYVLKNSINIRKYLKPDLRWLYLLLLIPVAAAVFILYGRLLPEKEQPADAPAPVAAEEVPPPSAKTPEPEIRPETKAEPEPEVILKQEQEPAPAPEEPEIIYTEQKVGFEFSVYFQPDSAVLTQKAISDLDAFISGLPSGGDFEEGTFTLAVKGHCAKFGTEEGRAELSIERAKAVFGYIESSWVMETDSSVSGVGASEPVSLDRKEQYLNRRVDIDIDGTIKIKNELYTEE